MHMPYKVVPHKSLTTSKNFNITMVRIVSPDSSKSLKSIQYKTQEERDYDQNQLAQENFLHRLDSLLLKNHGTSLQAYCQERDVTMWDLHSVDWFGYDGWPIPSTTEHWKGHHCVRQANIMIDLLPCPVLEQNLLKTFITANPHWTYEEYSLRYPFHCHGNTNSQTEQIAKIH